MSNNRAIFNLPTDSSNQKLLNEIPFDLQFVQPFNPNLPNYSISQAEVASFASVEQQIFVHDTFSSLNMANNNMLINGEVVYPRSPSNSPRELQYYDLQNAGLHDQWEQSNQPTPTVDRTQDFDYTGISEQESFSFSMEDITPLLRPSEGDEVYIKEVCDDQVTTYAPVAHGYLNYQQSNLSDTSDNIVLGVPQPSYQSFDLPPSPGLEEEIGDGLLESEPIPLLPSRPTRYGFVGEPDNNGALGVSEPSFSGSGTWQEDMDILRETPGPSSGAVSHHSSRRTSSCFFRPCLNESSSSFSSHSSDQGSPLTFNDRQGKPKRKRLSVREFNELTEEQRLSRKREQERISSKKHADRRRQNQLQVHHEYETLSLRNMDLRREATTLENRKLLMEEAKTRIDAKNVDYNLKRN